MKDSMLYTISFCFGVGISLLIEKLIKTLAEHDESEKYKTSQIANETTNTSPRNTPIAGVSAVQTKHEDHDIWNTAIFFPTRNEETSSYEKLVFYLKSARKSIDFALMGLSYKPLIQIIKDLSKKGVKIRFYTSYEKGMDISGQRFCSSGVIVKHQQFNKKYNTAMHNKYVIIDNKAILTGSMNWNQESLFSNRENILITNNKIIVGKYIQNFTKLWKNAYHQEKQTTNHWDDDEAEENNESLSKE